MALTEREKEVLRGLADEVRRTDKPLYANLTAGRVRRLSEPVIVVVWAVAGLSFIVAGGVFEQRWIAFLGWWSLILAALLNASREDRAPTGHGGCGSST